jgi:hypothetical protein
MRAYDWDPIRAKHYGQRSCEPHAKAEHMAAPTNAALVKKGPCQLGAVHTWPIATFRCAAEFDRYRDDIAELWQAERPADLWVYGLDVTIEPPTIP